MSSQNFSVKVRWYVLVLLTALLTGCPSGPTSPKRLGSTLGLSKVQIDEERAATATISAADGGTITAKSEDGTRFTLTIPPDALERDTEISLFPISSIADFPASGGVTAAVHCTPDGLRILLPATLTIELPPGADPATLTGFDYEGDAAEIDLRLVSTSGQTVTFGVSHFTGFGLALITPQDRQNNHAFEDTRSQAVRLLFGKSPPRSAADYIAYFSQLYDSGIRPGLVAAGTDDSGLRGALNAYLDWFGVASIADAILILGDPVSEADVLAGLASRIGELKTLLAAALKNGIKQENQRCTATTNDDRSMANAVQALSYQRIARIQGIDTEANQLDKVTVLKNLCLQVDYAEESFSSIQPGQAGLLGLKVGHKIGDHATAFNRQIDLTVHAVASGGTNGQSRDFGGNNNETPEAGRFARSVQWPADTTALSLAINACLPLANFQVCHDLLIVEGTPVQSIAISPSSAHVRPGGRLQFSALVTSGSNTLKHAKTGQLTAAAADSPALLIWSAARGAVTADGLYTAPDSQGTDTVTVTSAENPAIHASAEVQVGELFGLYGASFASSVIPEGTFICVEPFTALREESAWHLQVEPGTSPQTVSIAMHRIAFDFRGVSVPSFDFTFAATLTSRASDLSLTGEETAFEETTGGYRFAGAFFKSGPPPGIVHLHLRFFAQPGQDNPKGICASPFDPIASALVTDGYSFDFGQ